MLANEFNRKKAEIQNKIREEEARWRNVPAERQNARRQIQTLADQLEKLELQYSQDVAKKKVK